MYFSKQGNYGEGITQFFGLLGGIFFNTAWQLIKIKLIIFFDCLDITIFPNYFSFPLLIKQIAFDFNLGQIIWHISVLTLMAVEV